MVLLTCAATIRDDEITVEVDVAMVNPGGQQLSIEKAPLEGLYWTLVAIYVSLVVGCSAYAWTSMDRIALYTPHPPPS